jgi:hypothetical protein
MTGGSIRREKILLTRDNDLQRVQSAAMGGLARPDSIRVRMIADESELDAEFPGARRAFVELSQRRLAAERV